MGKIRKQNLRNIKNIFEEKTGTQLAYSGKSHHNRTAFRIVVFAAVAMFMLTMLAFAEQKFTPLDGDALTLGAVYEGGGIVTVYVENNSRKDLEFQNQLKLINWFTEEEAPRLGGRVSFSETRFPAESNGTMTIDLSQAYDISYLENDVQNPWYYLLLTNQDFLFGHDWMCSVDFAQQKKEVPESQTVPSGSAPGNPNEVEESLRFYFEEAYGGCPMAFNDANFLYQQRVEEAIARYEGNVVTALSPAIMVGSPSVFLDPEPMLADVPAGVVFDPDIPAEQQYLLVRSDWSYLDGFGRMVAGQDEKAWILYAMLPQRQGETDGGVSMPLRFLMVYETEAASVSKNAAFVYGRFLTFGEMEQYRIFKDAHYGIYDVTELIYTDLDVYLDYFLTTREDIYCDDAIRNRIHAIDAYFRDAENLTSLICYREK